MDIVWIWWGYNTIDNGIEMFIIRCNRFDLTNKHVDLNQNLYDAITQTNPVMEGISHLVTGHKSVETQRWKFDHFIAVDRHIFIPLSQSLGFAQII